MGPRSCGNRNFGRDSVYCASTFNICTLILLLFAVISNYWSWGYANNALLNSPSASSISISTGVWVAGQAWSTFAVPCFCNPICSVCVTATNPVLWNEIDASIACAPNSTVFQLWAGPLDLCTFPSGFDVPAPNPQFDQPFVSNINGTSFSRAPAGTTFTVPSQVIGMQAVTIISTITCFFAIIIGCTDAVIESRNTIVGISAATCAFLSWVFALTAVSLWTWVPYISRLQSSPPQIYMPIWVSTSGGDMTAIPVRNIWLGPAWGTMLTAFFILLFTMIIHFASLRVDREERDSYPAQSTAGYRTKEPDQPIPTVAQPVPPALTAVTPTTAGNNNSANSAIAAV